MIKMKKVASCQLPVASCFPHRRRGGFTLIELIVAMAILAILTTGGVATYIRSLKRGRDAQRKSDLSQVQRALEAYFNDKNRYPSGEADGNMGDCAGSACSWGTSSFEDEEGTVYMKLLPDDPSSDQSYFYQSNLSGGWYKLYAKLENEDDPQVLSETPVGADCGGVSEDCNYGVSSSNVAP